MCKMNPQRVPNCLPYNSRESLEEPWFSRVNVTSLGWMSLGIWQDDETIGVQMTKDRTCLRLCPLLWQDCSSCVHLLSTWQNCLSIVCAPIKCMAGLPIVCAPIKCMAGLPIMCAPIKCRFVLLQRTQDSGGEGTGIQRSFRHQSKIECKTHLFKWLMTRVTVLPAWDSMTFHFRDYIIIKVFLPGGNNYLLFH